MTEFTLADLLPRFEGWKVVSVVEHEDLTEIRLACGLEHAPSGTMARGVVFVTGRAPDNTPPLIGGKVSVDSGRLSAGHWEIAEGLIAGQLLESAIVVVEEGSHDPVTEPVLTAAEVLENGSLVWPLIGDLPEEHRGLELLEGVTRIAFTQPSLVASVTVGDADRPTRDAWDMFVTPFGAVETERHPDSGDPMIVSYFPLSDVPSRIWERTGVAGWMAPGGPAAPADRVVSVRTTFMDEAGLVAAALSWQETDDGALTTSEGRITPLALASELLRMLPGGDLDLEHSGKEVVGER